jgi:creatinine amidohydrolase
MYHFEGTFARPEYKELETGVIGDATRATREKGEKMVTAVVDHVCDLIGDIQARWPLGCKPPVK